MGARSDKAWTVTAGLGAALALAGVGFASPSLLVPGIAFLGLALVIAAWVELAARSARLVRARGPTRIVEGDEYPLRLELRRGWLPPPGGELTDLLLEEPVRIGPWRPDRLELELRMPRRGRFAIDGTRWTIRDPLSLCSRSIEAPPGGELLVLPRIESVESGSLGVAGLGAGSAGADADDGSSVHEARAVEFEVDGLRPYREGSPASRIHWPALARTGEMHERRMVAGGEASPLVVLDAERPDDEESLDRAVRAAASLCVHLAPAGGCALLLPGHRAVSPLDAGLRAWPVLHARLALVAAGAPAHVPSRTSRRGSVFWVTPGGVERPLGLARSFGPGPHYVVTARPPRAGRVAFTVAGCHGVAASGAGSLARAAA